MIFEEWWKQTKPAECDELKDYFIEAWNTSVAQYSDDLDRLVAIAVAAERDAFDRRLALQKASWERELALDVEAERKICERLVFAALYGWGNARELAVAAIRLRSNPL